MCVEGFSCFVQTTLNKQEVPTTDRHIKLYMSMYCVCFTELMAALLGMLFDGSECKHSNVSADCNSQLESLVEWIMQLLS